MQKYVLLIISLFILGKALTQTGLKEVFVERYYTFSKNDFQNGNLTGVTQKGLVAYRIYVELDSGYTLQGVFGSSTHPLNISSTKNFYNHPGIGNTHPDVIPDKSLKKNISILDSWITLGACAESFFAIPLKYQTKVLPVAIQWESGYLENTKGRDSKFSFRDAPGMVYVGSDSLPQLTLFQIDEQLQGLFASTSIKEIRVENGAWASMGKGVTAPKNFNNAILIAQLTTAGKLSYELNLLIGTPEGKSIKMVAANPIEGELSHPSLVKK